MIKAKNIISKPCSLKKVMGILQNTGKKVVLLINSNKKLLGLITDGDIRRCLLSGIDANHSIVNLVNKKPFCVNTNFNKKNIHNLFLKKKLYAIPVIEKSKLVDVLYFEDFISTNLFNTVDIAIPCGGYGKRLYPLTKNLPKCLIKIKKKMRIIDVIMNKLIKNNLTNFYFLTHYKHEMIKKYINKNYSNKKYFKKFYVEKTPLGTAGGLSLINYNKVKENLMVINCDVISDINIENLIRFHESSNSDCTIVTKLIGQKFDFGSIQNTKDNFETIEEKPITYHFTNTGIYVFRKSCLKVLKKNKHLNMNDFVTKLKMKKFSIKLYHSSEKWIDIGTKKNLYVAKQIQSF